MANAVAEAVIERDDRVSDLGLGIAARRGLKCR
jgi:hypothetical protein